MKKKRVLITGGSGLLAVNWALLIRDKYDVILLLHHKRISLAGVVTDHMPLDSKNNCQLVLDKHSPDVVINAAGITSVEICDSHPDMGKMANVTIPSYLSSACNISGIKLVHISTDHLFSGKFQYAQETDKPEPLNLYAKTKLQGEHEVLSNCHNALVIRTNFFGWGLTYRESFSDFILKKLRDNKSVNLFSDVFFTPILIEELCKKVSDLLDLGASGIFNIVGNERISKYEFGVRLANSFGLNTKLINATSVNRSDLVVRPKDMSLSNRKLNNILDSSIPSLDQQFTSLKLQESENPANQVKLEVIPYGKHYIDDDDIQSVVDVLRDGLLTQGPKVVEFERKLADYVGAKYAVAVANGTAALHLASMAIGIGKDDKVITSPNSFVATSNSILYVRACPTFVDIDPQTLNIDVNKIEKTIIGSKNIKAIFPVHFAGLPCDMARIKQIAEQYNLLVVEDASHALGAFYDDGTKVGNCKYSDMTTFSFHPVKGIAAGEGGMITTNSKSIYRKLMRLRSHGITKGNFEFPGISEIDNSLINQEEALEDGVLKRWYYEMQYLGYNYRISDIQCALASSQMNKLDLFINTRKKMVDYYDRSFLGMPHIKPMQQHNRGNSSHHIYVVHIDFERIGITRQQFMQDLATKGIGSQVHYIPIVMQPYYQNMGYKIHDYPCTYKHYQSGLSIPLYFGLSRIEQESVVLSISSIINRHSGASKP